MLKTVKNKNNTKVFITRPAQNKEMIEEKNEEKTVSENYFYFNV